VYEYDIVLYHELLKRGVVHHEKKVTCLQSYKVTESYVELCNTGSSVDKSNFFLMLWQKGKRGQGHARGMII
jgi:hypothetical protein